MAVQSKVIPTDEAGDALPKWAWPVAIVGGVAITAAVAYVLFGGSSNSNKKTPKKSKKAPAPQPPKTKASPTKTETKAETEVDIDAVRQNQIYSNVF